ncbi:MAG: GxxExxY protein [Verrucomicrobiota bacterium]|nr:GxxExxY protein [Verrucomicrobiota bacterium]
MNLKDPQTFEIIGAAMEVHKELKNGFLESVYQDALAVELFNEQVEFNREIKLPIFYKGSKLPSSFRADFVCFGSIIVETKAIKKLTEIEEAQILNYLKITRLPRGLLINFGANSLEYKRFVFSEETQTKTPISLF